MLGISKEKYEVKIGSKKLMLLKKLMTMKKDESINMDQYFKGVKEILDYLEGINFSIPTKVVVLLIFNSLPSQYNLFLKIMTTKDSLCIQEKLKSHLLNDELHIKIDGSNGTTKNVLVVHGKIHKYSTPFNPNWNSKDQLFMKVGTISNHTKKHHLKKYIL